MRSCVLKISTVLGILQITGCNQFHGNKLCSYTAEISSPISPVNYNIHAQEKATGLWTLEYSIMGTNKKNIYKTTINDIYYNFNACTNVKQILYSAKQATNVNPNNKIIYLDKTEYQITFNDHRSVNIFTNRDLPIDSKHEKQLFLLNRSIVKNNINDNYISKDLYWSMPPPFYETLKLR